MKKIPALSLVLFALGCANPWAKMEGYFVEEKTRIHPANNYERTVAEAASFHLYKHREASFPEIIKSIPEFLMENPLPPLWIKLLWQMPDRWKFRPVDEEKFEGVIVFRKPDKEGKTCEVRAVINNKEMVTLAKLLVSGEDYTAFLKKYDPNYKYDEIKGAAEYVRNALIREILTSSVPADIGEPMVPILIEAAERGYYPRFCVQSLQIITGQFFGYPPEFIDLLDPVDMLMFRAKQREAIKKWRRWYDNVYGNGRVKAKNKNP